jgi:hypothetical protein
MTYRRKFYSRAKSVQQIAAGRYQIEHDAGVFTVDGGAKLGGSASCWFLSGPNLGGEINVSGVTDALNLLENL